MTDLHIQKLLGREEVDIDLKEIAAYLDKQTVLVTGAGGSIGSELCRQISRFKPQKLLLLGRGEQSIYYINSECRTRFPDLPILPIIADIRDQQRMCQVFQEFRPQVVFHTAAHKNVELIEAYPEEVVKNNIIGTKTVSELAHEYGTQRFVLISTDKAVKPACVYGAGKRLSEFQIESLARNSDTIFVTVRFGNVLGARGSIIPLFQKQIADGGPVTVQPEATRYFMTIPEAARLVIQSGAMGKNGEIFILDMGKPMRILDLATEMIRLAGKEPGIDIQIQLIDLRPGDKLHEELLTQTEGVCPTRHPKIFIAKPDKIDIKKLDSLIATLSKLAENSDRLEIVQQLCNFMPDYQPSTTWSSAKRCANP
jgi:FlaA1/EpsC-like NDP-sugar epimerase